MAPTGVDATPIRDFGPPAKARFQSLDALSPPLSGPSAKPPDPATYALSTLWPGHPAALDVWVAESQEVRGEAAFDEEPLPAASPREWWACAQSGWSHPTLLLLLTFLKRYAETQKLTCTR